jgi:hypothetical protein
MSEAISTMQRIFPGKFVLLFMHPIVVIVTSQPVRFWLPRTQACTGGWRTCASPSTASTARPSRSPRAAAWTTWYVSSTLFVGAVCMSGHSLPSVRFCVPCVCTMFPSLSVWDGWYYLLLPHLSARTKVLLGICVAHGYLIIRWTISGTLSQCRHTSTLAIILLSPLLLLLRTTYHGFSPQVVENKAVAKECINYLRDQRVGTCVFLPLDNINPPPLSEKARSFGERYKPCLHLLKFDEQYKVRPIFVAPG